jgi:hypothetical protein
MRLFVAGTILLGTGLNAYRYPQPAASAQKALATKPASYELRADFSPEKRQQTLAEVREHLWVHWHLRQPTQLTVAECEIGKESHTTYAIGADADGIWQLSINSKSVVADPWYPDQKYHQQFMYHVYSVERMRNGGSPIRLPVEAQVPPDSYHLVLLDKAGKIVQNL